MVKNYKIRVHVEIVESEEEIDETIEQTAPGEFELVLPEAEAGDIDICENAVLHVNAHAIRDAVERHLSSFSKKKPS